MEGPSRPIKLRLPHQRHNYGRHSASYDYLFRVMLLGDSGVGKSSLFFRFADNTFTDSYIATIGVDFKVRTVELDSKKIKLQLWDTAGQERFRAITDTCFRGTHGFIIVYDVTKQETFDHIKHWIVQIEKHSEDAARLLVGNKQDLVKDRMVKYDTAKKYSDLLGMPFIETSAKDSTNVESAFLAMAEEVKRSVDSRPALMSRPNEGTISLHESTPVQKKKKPCCGKP